MNVTLSTPDGAQRLDAKADEYGVSVFATPSRAVRVFRNTDTDEKLGEGPYFAYWMLRPDADAEHEHFKVFGDKTFDERVLAVIFDGADVEPELPTEVVNLDGVSVIRIDLDKQLSGHAVLIPEELCSRTHLVP